MFRDRYIQIPIPLEKPNRIAVALALAGSMAAAMGAVGTWARVYVVLGVVSINGTAFDAGRICLGLALLALVAFGTTAITGPGGWCVPGVLSLAVVAFIGWFYLDDFLEEASEGGSFVGLGWGVPVMFVGACLGLASGVWLGAKPRRESTIFFHVPRPAEATSATPRKPLAQFPPTGADSWRFSPGGQERKA